MYTVEPLIRDSTTTNVKINYGVSFLQGFQYNVYYATPHSMSNLRRAPLVLNCGHALVSVYQNSNPAHIGRNARRNIDFAQRLDAFMSQFSTYPNYGVPVGYLDPKGKDHCSLFDRDCRRFPVTISGRHWAK